MVFCCFVTIKDLPLGFLWSQIFHWHDRGWGRGAPPTCRPPFFLVVVVDTQVVAEYHRQGSTHTKLIVDTRLVAKHHRRGRLQLS